MTLFPEMFVSPLGSAIFKRASDRELLKIAVHNFRDCTHDKHHTVDDTPYGGGAGMVLKPEPIFEAVEAIKSEIHTKDEISEFPVILLTPQGYLFSQQIALELSKHSHLILICGHYEGIDERVRQYLADAQISIGDYVLTGGELPAMVLVDSVVRLIPGVLGDRNSLNFESFEGNLLEYPQYSRPARFRKWQVPKVLVSGAHDKISAWRKSEALKRTRQRRPDLLKKIG